MRSDWGTRKAALIALAATLVLFAEYLPPLNRVAIPYDLAEYHYPLMDYAHLALKAGRIPLWDSALYCGIPYAGNTQTALFYPPSWLLYLANVSRPHLRYASIEIFVILHVWLAFVLAYGWFRSGRLHPLACALGAGAYAISGYMITQLQHLGLVIGFAWWPLAFQAIDEAHEKQDWRRLYKLAIASAGVLLGGYIPFWTVFAISAAAYAAARRRPWPVLLASAAGLLFSMALCAVELTTAIEAARHAVQSARFGNGVRNPLFFITYVIPNFWDFAMSAPINKNPGLDYWYLGAAALAGIAFAAARCAYREMAPALAMGTVALFVLLDPFNLIAHVLREPSIVAAMFRSWYFIAGVTASLSFIAAVGIDALLRKRPATAPSWLPSIVTCLIAAWCVRLIVAWSGGGKGFAEGWMGIRETVIAATLATAALLLFARSAGRMRTALGCALLVLSLAEYKAFGTSKRFGAEPETESKAREFSSARFPGLDPQLVTVLRDSAPYRVLLDAGGLISAHVRHAGASTPQGFDPLLPRNYQAFVETHGRFLSDREFVIDISRCDAMDLLGVRYLLTREGAPQFSRASAAGSGWIPVQPTASPYPYRLFERTRAKPPYAWVDGVGESQALKWLPEDREIRVSSQAGGRFRLAEQWYPGWEAAVDGKPAAIERCDGAFDCITVPTGAHVVRFRYRPMSLRIGAAVSGFSVLLFAVFLYRLRALKSYTP